MTNIWQNPKKKQPQGMQDDPRTCRAEMNHDEIMERKLKNRTTGIAPTNKQIMRHV